LWIAVALACGSGAGPISATACTEQCIALAGSDSAFCAPVCSTTCAQRCTDLMTRMGGGLSCTELCASTCPELHDRFDFNAEACAWIVEDRPSPTVTPRELRR
jgi:hypothetical protein